MKTLKWNSDRPKDGDYEVFEDAEGNQYRISGKTLAAATKHPCNEYGTFDFGEAIRRLKAGQRVSRAGWNVRGTWVVLMPPLKLAALSSREPGAKVNDRTAKHIGADTPLYSLPYLAMWTVDKWQPGWLASQADMLADDWQLAE